MDASEIDQHSVGRAVLSQFAVGTCKLELGKHGVLLRCIREWVQGKAEDDLADASAQIVETPEGQA